MAARTWTAGTLSDVAAFFAVPRSTVEYWRTQGLPGKPGAWDLAEIARWRIAKIDEVSSDLNAELKKADIRLKTAQAVGRELETAKERGELVELREVELWASTTLTECREHIMSMPETLAVSMPPEHRNFVRDEVDRVCRNTLTTLQRNLEMKSFEESSADVVDDGDDLE